MAVDWNERYRRQELDERIYGAIRTGDWRTALMELFKEVRQVQLCKHGNMTDYQPCPQCDAELDDLISGEYEDDARQVEARHPGQPRGRIAAGGDLRRS